jgi:hypothetical protein
MNKKITFLKCTLNFSLWEWNCDYIMLAEEYWWEITQQWGGDVTAGRVSMCQSFKFQLDSLVCVCVCVYIHTHSWQYVCSIHSIYTCTKIWLVPNLLGPNYCVSHGACVHIKKLHTVFSILLPLPPYQIQMFSSAPCSQTPTACVLPLMWHTKCHTLH